MNIHATDWTMTSDITPEWAYRIADGVGPVWRLTWLPDRRLSREQALAGMELDEILSAPAAVNDRLADAQSRTRADRLGILLEQAVILLWKQIADRPQYPGPSLDDGDATTCETPGADETPCRTRRPHRLATRAESPRVYR